MIHSYWLSIRSIKLIRRSIPAIAIGISALGISVCQANDDVVGYDQVKDILRKRCVTCHNPDEMRGDLDLKDLAAIKAGSASGPVVVAKDSAASLLYTTLAHLEDPTMPPNSPRIPEREQDLIRRWIDGGLLEKSDTKSNPSVDRANSNSRLTAIRPLLQAPAVNTLEIHPQKNLLAVAGLQQVVLFDTASRQFIGAIDVAGDVSALRFSVDGKLLLVAVSQPAVSSVVIALDVERWTEVWKIGDETDSILAMDLSPDGNTLAVAGPAKVVRLLDTKSGQIVHTLKKHTDWILDLRFSPDGLLLASCDRFGSIIVWEPKNGTVFHNLKDHVGPVHAISWDLGSDTLISGGDDGILRTWNMHHGDLTSRWDGQVGPILAIARTRDFFAATGRKNLLSVWKSADQLIGKLELKDQGESLCVQEDGKLLIVGDASGHLSILDSQNLQLVQQTTLPIDSDSLAQLLTNLETKHATYLAEAKLAEVKQGGSTLAGSKLADARLAGSRTADPDAKSTTKSADIKKSSNAPPPTPLDSSSIAMRSPAASAKSSDGGESARPSPTTQLAENQLLLDQTMNLLQASNRSLADLSQLNEDLIRMLARSTQIQQQMAQQIAEQAKQLETLQDRQRNIEESSRAAGEPRNTLQNQSNDQLSIQKK